MAATSRIRPSFEQRLALLGQAAQYDLSCACGGKQEQHRQRAAEDRWIYPAALPSGRRVPILKLLQTGGCERNCAYCVQRCGGAQLEDASFTSEEVAGLFLELRRQNRVQGLFLSSAIRGGAPATMDRLLKTAELLRLRQRYRGYLHLKLVPGCRPDQIERAVQLATRVSVNMEAPSAEHLARIAPTKDFNAHILETMRRVAQAQASGSCVYGGQTTQFVVGAAGESDSEIAHTSADLYRRFRLSRVYYSAFQPLPDTPLAGQPPVPLLREHRLYQMDFLLRKYRFGLEEIPFDARGQLSLEADPKTLWARAHPERFPVEVNTAPPEELMRVPGIGPVSAQRILELRRANHLRQLAELRAAGARVTEAAPYLLLDGRAAPVVKQLELFA